MNFKKIAIIGAGAVGCYILWGLLNKEDIDISVIAQGERKERIESEGLVINDKLYRPKVKTPAEAYGADLVIVAVKYNDLRSAVADIKESLYCSYGEIDMYPESWTHIYELG